MSDLRSWFSKASSSRHGSLSNSRHELPRWRASSPMVASTIPPPIVQSTYAAHLSHPSQSVVIEKAAPLDDRQLEIEADLQFLLDVQAEELERGRRGGIIDDQTSTGSTTPTAHSGRSTSNRHTMRPARRKPGLRSARKGIYNSILALSAVKDEELQLVDAEIDAKDTTLAQMESWEQKRHGLQEARASVDENEDTVRVQRLRQEATTLQQDINHVEMQLFDMKARQRKLLQKAASVENALQAKSATYTSSLSLLEAEVQTFLASTPVDAMRRHDAETSVWQLPPTRRTLDMARAQHAADREAVLLERRDIEHENEALRQGALMWKEVTTQVGGFEMKMRAEMSNMSASGSAWEDPPQSPDPPTSLRDLLQELQPVLESLEFKFKTAEEKDWRLLIAAIGAELDAFRQGKTILEALLGIKPPEPDLVDADPDEGEGRKVIADEGGGREIHELDKSFGTARPALRSRDSSDTEDTDNDPDPELMFSRRDVNEDDH